MQQGVLHVQRGRALLLNNSLRITRPRPVTLMLIVNAHDDRVMIRHSRILLGRTRSAAPRKYSGKSWRARRACGLRSKRREIQPHRLKRTRKSITFSPARFDMAAQSPFLRPMVRVCSSKHRTRSLYYTTIFHSRIAIITIVQVSVHFSTWRSIATRMPFWYSNRHSVCLLLYQTCARN